MIMETKGSTAAGLIVFLGIICFASELLGSPVISQDQTAVQGGTVILSCTNAALAPVAWEKSSGQITICSGTTCSVTSSGTYTFTSSATATDTTIVVTINPVDRSGDEDTWICKSGGSSDSISLMVYTAATGVTLTEHSSTCDSSSAYTCVIDNCVYPTDSTSSAFQWSYISGGTETQISSSEVTITRTLLTDSCTGNERKIQSELTGITGISAVSSSSLIFKCTFKQPGLTDRSATASSSCTITTHSAFG